MHLKSSVSENVVYCENGEEILRFKCCDQLLWFSSYIWWQCNSLDLYIDIGLVFLNKMCMYIASLTKLEKCKFHKKEIFLRILKFVLIRILEIFFSRQFLILKNIGLYAKDTFFIRILSNSRAPLLTMFLIFI